MWCGRQRAQLSCPTWKIVESGSRLPLRTFAWACSQLHRSGDEHTSQAQLQQQPKHLETNVCPVGYLVPDQVACCYVCDAEGVSQLAAVSACRGSPRSATFCRQQKLGALNNI